MQKKKIKYILTSLFLVFHAKASLDISKKEGLLWGSIYGDTFGGPYEFQAPKQHNLIKKNRRLSQREWIELADSIKLIQYPIKRSAYGVWTDYAPAGTITDDTRHKILLVKSYKDKKTTRKEIARIYSKFSLRSDGMYKEWLSEYSKSAWYILDPKHPKAYPLERLWGGIPTQAGQMIFIPHALLFAGRPKEAYLDVYKINFFDQGVAKDFTSSLIAGLAQSVSSHGSWSSFKNTIKNNDPYNYKNIPYLKRDVNECMKLALNLVDHSHGVPQRLFKLLEKNLNAKTWWEAHTSFIVSLAFLEMAYRNNSPMAAFELVKSFGHDTDSYAQVIGAVIGSIEGIRIFNQSEIDLIKKNIKNEFGDVFKDLL